MGCACSKRAALVEAASPVIEYSAAAPGASNDNRSLSYVYSSKNPSGLLELDPKVAEAEEQEQEQDKSDDHRGASRELKKSKKGSSQRKNPAFTIKLGFNQRHVDAEQIAAGWPAWLTAAAGEAVHGLVPLRAESFEKLEKVTKDCGVPIAISLNELFHVCEYIICIECKLPIIIYKFCRRKLLSHWFFFFFGEFTVKSF